MRLVVVSGLISALFVFVATPLLITFLRRHGYAQAIRVSTEDEPYPEHESKRGTPSMGGVAIVLAVLVSYLLTHLLLWQPPTPSALLVLFLMLGLGGVGVADDYLKIFKQRATGLRARTKLIGQAIVAIAFAVLALQFPNAAGETPASTALSFVRDTGFVLPTAVFVLWVWFLVTATTNGVNLTDGLDGLATGAATMTFVAYILIGIWQFNQSCFSNSGPTCYDTAAPLDLAVVAAGLAGACFAFLWYNTAPARIFMGDTGSLAIGGAIAGLAVVSRTELLLALLGGLFLLVSMSVIGQVASYRLLHRRLLLMAPLHHHFEMKGWPEIQIVVRFWIIQGLFIGLGLTLFYTEWVNA
ncbi:MAG: phospho-N-acetylmuramoyl-pentapeptide-transferase [Actinomycetes bacterium]|jgi:phospho-N-acetylmuramoyl-pentapeptide-transferase|nr:phospho-N-acetylmuramoyl-pentapeptide-transferase [Candidatus Nanopelagicales bacterium]MDP4824479.1 phospho-N-acetylmuramoyl-pentapeptide-transferase [Candidatus Nanopelagicales bacterium]MDP4888230.1 phospho-N-acetylmuramoyl-pentapeptide-transferase [Candidatus Nanopelagicales bacterium]